MGSRALCTPPRRAEKLRITKPRSPTTIVLSATMRFATPRSRASSSSSSAQRRKDVLPSLVQTLQHSPHLSPLARSLDTRGSQMSGRDVRSRQSFDCTSPNQCHSPVVGPTAASRARTTRTGRVDSAIIHALELKIRQGDLRHGVSLCTKSHGVNVNFVRHVQVRHVQVYLPHEVNLHEVAASAVPSVNEELLYSSQAMSSVMAALETSSTSYRPPAAWPPLLTSRRAARGNRCRDRCSSQCTRLDPVVVVPQ